MKPYNMDKRPYVVEVRGGWWRACWWGSDGLQRSKAFRCSHAAEDYAKTKGELFRPTRHRRARQYKAQEARA